jgi:glycosyltransferase involved in cell wall biosynthesis
MTDKIPKIRVFFWQRSRQRERQRDTVRMCPDGIQALTLRTAQVDETRLVAERSSKARVFLSALVRCLWPINFRWITGWSAHESEVVYSWGILPIGRAPYILELDNPYALTWYQVRLFRLLRPLLRRFLMAERCRAIVCISAACRRNLLAELGAELAPKTRVVYPFIDDYKLELQSEASVLGHNRSESSALQTGLSLEDATLVKFDHESNEQVKLVTFLYVSTSFTLKGGRQLLRAFSNLVATGAAARLVCITRIPADIAIEFDNCHWLVVEPPTLNRKELRERFFATADVFVLPTIQDSFGMVLLEALANRLPIISTNLYAIPEMVNDGQSGLLVSPPFRYFDNQDCAVAAYWNKRIERHIEHGSFADFEQSIFRALLQCMNASFRDQARHAADELFMQRFHPRVRSRAFLEAVRAAIPVNMGHDLDKGGV